MAQRVPMTMHQIYEKTFKRHLYGYDCRAVDEFLDEIIKDYSCFQLEIETLMDENLSLKKQLRQKRETVNKLRQDKGHVNYDIVKRVSNLEKKVFQDRLNENFRGKPV